MKRLAILLLTSFPLFATSFKTSVIGSQHDLSVAGSGPVKSGVIDACIFCHAPHNITPNITPLWNHTLSSVTYTTYTSTTYTAGAQTPSAGSSKLCLSCHDGTVAVGLTVAQGLIATTGSMAAVDVFGSNLATSHPVSMTPVDDGSLATSLFATTPLTKDPAVNLDSGKVECITCHDPHAPKNDPTVQKFLVRSNANGAMCLACHDPTRTQPNFLNGWTSGSHATSPDTVPTTAGLGAYGTVASNACSSCHNAHNNNVGPRNLTAAEEAACSPCHNGGANTSPALVNVMGEFSKTYAHPTLTVSGAHDAAESLPVNSTRHAECADCHNPHTATPSTGTSIAPNIQGSMTGVSGYDTTGAQRPASTEYQVCYKCHADSSNKPATSTYGRTASRYPAGPLPAGTIVTPMPPDQYNIRLKFLSTISHNVSGHSVPTTTVKSLLPYMLDVNKASMTSRPLSLTTVIYCTDCHNNNSARASNGTGPNGPHASTFTHLLQFNLFQEPGSPGSTGYDLCAKCHSISTLRNDGVHGEHLGDGAACTTCHDPHGVIGGTTNANLGMVNLDTAIATKRTGSTYYGMSYNGTQFSCYLNCHGQGHNGESFRYP